MFLLTGLSLHLLDLNRVGLAAAHVQLMVAHAQGQDPLVDAQTRSKEYKVLSWREQMFQLSFRELESILNSIMLVYIQSNITSRVAPDLRQLRVQGHAPESL